MNKIGILSKEMEVIKKRKFQNFKSTTFEMKVLVDVLTD